MQDNNIYDFSKDFKADCLPHIIALKAFCVSRGIPFYMTFAIKNDKTFDEVASDTDIVAHFKNPAMPSVAMTADAAIKIASARQGFAETDTFLEMIGFDKADVRRIKAQERINQGLELVSELE